MGRLDEAEAERLSRTLGARAAVPGDADRASVLAGDDALRRVTAVFGDAAASDALGRALTLDLASYLNRPVRCSVTAPAPPVSQGWRFSADAAGFTWWMEVDPGLAAALADAMIGGDGTASPGHGRRARALVELVMLRMLAAIAGAAGLDPPEHAIFEIGPTAGGTALAGGLCAVAADQYGWQVGVALDKASPAPTAPIVERPTHPVRPLQLQRVSHIGVGDAAAPPIHPHGPVLPFAPPAETASPEKIVQSVVAALCAQLQDILRCQIDGGQPEIAEVSGAELAAMPPSALRLALTAGGNGALVAILDREAVAGLAGGAAGAAVPAAASPGDVVIAAAEAVIREALAEVARRLPGIVSDTHRIVRLAEDPLPARTPHHSANVRLTVSGRAGALRLLVPSWMLSQPKGHRASTEIDRHG